MRIEAFSQAREPARPETNEDALVIVPGRAYAVIDGVTDRNGTRYDGMLAGRYAARLVAARLEALALGGLPEAEEIVPDLTALIAEAYRRHKVDIASGGWGGRMCCTLALAIPRANALDVLLVGDSGIRLGGPAGHVLQMSKDLDRITATLRQHAWPHIATAVQDPAERERLARQLVFRGTGQNPQGLALTAETLAAIAAAAGAACRAALPHVPAAEIAFLHREGIVDGQGAFQNTTDSILGYACLDGTEIPRSLIRISRFETASFTAPGGAPQIELFTDGYARPAPGFGLAAWEADFAATEKQDPHKTGAFPGVKGTLPGRWSDDRTYLAIEYD